MESFVWNLKKDTDKLAYKITRVERFIGTSTFENLSNDEKILLSSQYESMQALYKSMNSRLSYYDEVSENDTVDAEDC